MLDELDKELTKRGLKFCRYADDCDIYVKSRMAARRVMESITWFIEGELKLKVNRDKSAVDRPWRQNFLVLEEGFECAFERDGKMSKQDLWYTERYV